MKKVIYSSVLKLIAVLLLIASVTTGVWMVIDGVLAYDRVEKDIYSFESDFSESWYLSYLLSIPEDLVFQAYYTRFDEDETDDGIMFAEEGTTAEGVTEDSENSEWGLIQDPEIIARNLARLFERVYGSDEIHYFVQWNDLVFTNCGATSAEDLMQGEYYTYLKKDSTGDVERLATVKPRRYQMESLESIGDGSTIVVSCCVKDEVAREYKAMWEYQEGIVFNCFARAGICAAVALLMLIYLLCVCGKNAAGEYKNMWLDRVWLEVHLAAMAGAVIGAIALCVCVLEAYMSGNFPLRLIGWTVGGATALGSLILFTSLLSIIRNIKTRRFMESSVIFQILRWMLRLLVRMIKWIGRKLKAFGSAVAHLFAKKTGVMFVCMLLVYTALIGMFGMAALSEFTWVLAGILLFLLACFVVGVRARDLDEVKKGVSEVRNGNVSYQIPELKCEDMKALAGNVNSIAQGLDDAVSAKVKAERMKTELITNVSHDLKTPITSIISYTELLSNRDDLPEDAKDYVAVIAKKGARLKRLTQDLFDISKVQSGNEDVVLEKLDVGLLISQALGEQDSEIQGSGLTFCVDTPKDLYISADGRKMSRVLGNLIQNILKYSMAGTRVFITAAEREGKIEMVFKNISAYPLNFSEEEITGRFVRGDESRTTEGNGLGLAIAKSYTEICNGHFEVVVDGDLFKAILTFKKYQ